MNILIGNFDEGSIERISRSKEIKSENIVMELLRNKKSRLGISIIFAFVIIGVIGAVWTPYSPSDTAFTAWQAPTFAHLFGTDYNGHDVFTWFLIGTGISLFVGFSVAIFSTLLGSLVGLVSGFYGGLLDNALMRTVDILLIMPVFPLLVILSAYLPPTNETTILILSALSWPFMSRVIRSQVLTLKERPFIKAAILSGMSGSKIISHEVLKHVLPLIIINGIYLMVGAIVAQAGLAFFGLGDITSISWGTSLYWAQAEDAVVYAAWWWILPPGLSIALIGIAANLFGSGLTEVFGRKTGEV